MTWRNQPDSNYVSLHIFDETTGNTEVGLGSSFSGAGPSYTAEGGELRGTATSRTVYLNCR